MQFSVKLFVENEVKNVRYRVHMLIVEIIVIIILAGLFIMAYTASGKLNMALNIVMITFLVLVLSGVHQYFMMVSYMKKVKDFKAHVDEVYARHQQKVQQ